MSGISGITGQSSLLEQLQQVARNKGAASGSETQAAQATQTTGIDLAGIDGLRDQVQTAVEEAITNYEGASGSELMTKIEEAVSAVLEESGVDAEEFKAQFAEMRSEMSAAMQGAAAQAGPPVGGPPPGPPPGGPPPGGGGPAGETEEVESIDASTTNLTTDSPTGTTETGETTTALSTDDEVVDTLEEYYEELLEYMIESGGTTDQTQVKWLANLATTMLFGPAIDRYA